MSGMVSVQNIQRLVRLRPQTLVRQLRVLQDTLGGTGHSGHDLSFALTTAAHLRRLNRLHTGKDESTDVLSFALEHDAGHDDSFSALTADKLLSAPFIDASGSITKARREDLPNDLGSVYVSTDHVLAHSALYRFAPADYLLAVAAHGVAHLVGYRHDTAEQWADMRDAECRALSVLYGASAWCDRHPSPTQVARDMPIAYLPIEYSPCTA